MHEDMVLVKRSQLIECAELLRTSINWLSDADRPHVPQKIRETIRGFAIEAISGVASDLKAKGAL